MIFFLISILAGLLTILAPCILPLLPIVIGSSADETGKYKISSKSVTIISTLLISVIIFTLLLKASTLLITIPNYFWSIFSGVLIILVGLSMLFPDAWSKIKLVQKINSKSNQTLGSGFQKKSKTGDIIIGLSLGPVFTTCSPTYLFIIATVLPASFGKGLIYLLGFVLGLGLSLVIIAIFGQKIITKLTKNTDKTDKAKKVFAFVLIIIGLMIATGLDKKLETAILDSGYGATIDFEERLISNFGQ